MTDERTEPLEVDPEVHGPWAVIAGGSEGVGAELADQLGQRGLHLVLIARNPKPLLDTARQVTQRHGVQVRTLAGDLLDPAVAQRIRELCADLDVGTFIYNTGANTYGAEFADGALASFQKVIDLNITRQLELTQHFPGRLKKRGKGAIVLETALRSLLAGRRSCRAFLPTPVPETTVRSLLTMAQRTPSWCNSQPWQVLITSGRETEAFRAFLAQRVETAPGVFDVPPPRSYEGVYRERRQASGFALYDSVGIAHGDAERRRQQAMENFRFFGAPHVAIVTSEAELGPYGYVDCGGYISTFLLAATSLGIATIAQAAIAGYSDAVREHFGLSATRHVLCGISFGYADTAHRANAFRTERADLEEVADLRGF